MAAIVNSTDGKIHAAGGFNIKVKVVKVPNQANSIAVTGVSASDILIGAACSKMSGNVVKTSADFYTACTIGAAKVVIAGGVKACSGAALTLIFAKYNQ